MNAAAPASPPARAPRPRWRRWTRAVVTLAVAIALIGGAALWWLLSTDGGRDTLLERIVARLPPDSLHWERAEGVVRGPLVLYGVRYREGEIEFTAERVLLDPDLLPVLGNRVQLDRLEVDAATLTLPAAEDEPFALPEWPGSLPRIPMPLDLRATTLRLRGLAIARGDAPPLTIASADASALQFVDDGFRVTDLRAIGDFGTATLTGDYLPARAYRHDFIATLARPARDDVPPVSLRLVARGDVRKLDVSLVGRAPGEVTATLVLEGDEASPAWTLQARADALDPRLLGAAPGDPWRGTLAMAGRGGDAEVSGDVHVAGLDIGVAPSRLHLADGVLRAEPLLLALPQGPLRLAGTLTVGTDAPVFDATVASDGFVLTPEGDEPGAAPVRVVGEVHAEGRPAAWTLAGDGTLARAGTEARVELRGDGDEDALRVETLRVRMPGGALDGRGRVARAPALSVELDARLAGFDPGYFVPDYPGVVDAALVVAGTRADDGAWRGQVRAVDLAGQLRGRALSGRAQLDWHGRGGEIDADIGLGASRMRVAGGLGERFDLQAAFAPLQLADVLPGAEGRVAGTLELSGPSGAIDIAADLDAGDLAWNGDRAGSLRVVGRLPARSGAGELRVTAGAVDVGGLALDTLAVVARGRQDNLQLEADAAGAHGTARVAGALARAGSGWRGRVDVLRAAPTRGPALALTNGFAFAFADDVVRFDRACLRAVEAGGQLCAAADGRQLDLDGDALPLALLQPLLPVDAALPMEAFGVVAIDARLQRTGGEWRGTGRLTSARGGLRIAEEVDHDAFAYDDLRIELTLAEGFDGTLAATLPDGGRASASLRGGRDARAPLLGEVRLDVRDLAWLELFSEDIAAPVGHLTGTLAIGGTRAAPALSGTAGLTGFAAELPGLGVKLRAGRFDLVGTDDGSVRVNGSVASGDGTLRLDGSVHFRDDTAPVELVLRGEKVTLASTPELYLVGDPDLTLRWLADALQVRGTLDVGEARLDLESLDTDVTVSPDVVVVDPLEAAGARERPLDLDFAVRLGDDVALEGFGLDGTMTGAVTLRQKPGRAATADGTLQVAGTYRAYGRVLTIERARLAYANAPFDDPTLDIRADREVGDVVVGVQVRGSARRPDTTLVSRPAMDTNEALSWLLFGRPLSTASSGETQQLGAAALALGAGGGLVAASLGLDEVGVVDSRNLGGATFTVGKYVSPRLFLSYGVSLVGTGQVVTLKYLLARGFDISVESGNENAASVNWRTER